MSTLTMSTQMRAATTAVAEGGFFSLEGIDLLVGQAVKAVNNTLEIANELDETTMDKDQTVLDQITVVGCWCG